MKKTILMMLLCIFTLSVNAQTHKSRSHQSKAKTTKTVSKSTTRSPESYGSAVPLDQLTPNGFLSFAGKKNGKRVDITLYFNDEPYTFTIDGKEYSARFDSDGRIVAEDGDVIFDGYVRGSRIWYLVGKFYGKDVAFKVSMD